MTVLQSAAWVFGVALALAAVSAWAAFGHYLDEQARHWDGWWWPALILYWLVNLTCGVYLFSNMGRWLP